MDCLQALDQGLANETQQKALLDWLIHDGCKTYDLSYRPERPYDSAFMEGKRSVGLEIVALLKINTTEIRRRENV
jgi:hypothetical protein